eukprot:594184-Hanusia_phi.AAC.1
MMMMMMMMMRLMMMMMMRLLMMMMEMMMMMIMMMRLIMMTKDLMFIPLCRSVTHPIFPISVPSPPSCYPEWTTGFLRDMSGVFDFDEICSTAFPWE